MIFSASDVSSSGRLGVVAVVVVVGPSCCCSMAVWSNDSHKVRQASSLK